MAHFSTTSGALACKELDMIAERRLDAGARETAVRLVRDALVTIVALLLVFAAFDDITTDNATEFSVEYTILVVCAGWLLYLAVRLLRAGHRVLGSVSLLALAIAIWGQRAIGPGIVPGLWPEYVATTGAYFWFWALSFILLWRSWQWSGWHEHPVRDQHTT